MREIMVQVMIKIRKFYFIPIIKLLIFDPVAMPEKCCSRPKIVAIAEIETFFRWEALQVLAWIKLWTTPCEVLQNLF
jgi:hypothetical protein